MSSGGILNSFPRGLRPRQLQSKSLLHLVASVAERSSSTGRCRRRRLFSKHRTQVSCEAIDHELEVGDLSNVPLAPDAPSTSGRPAEYTWEDLYEAGKISESVLITRKLQSAAHLQDLLEVIYVHGEDFDHRHTPQAIHCLATLYRQCWRDLCHPPPPPSPPAAAPPSPPPDPALHMQHLQTEFVRPCLRLLGRLVVRDVACYEPRDISLCFWSLAVLDHRDERFLALLARRGHAIVTWFNPQDIANTFWAYARLELGNTVGFGEGDLLQRLLPTALRQLRAFKGQEVASLVYACGRMGRSPGGDFLAGVVALVTERLDDLGGRELANVMWGLAKLRHQDRDFLRLLAGRLSGGQAALMQPADISVVLWAFGRLGFRPKALLAELPDQLAWKMDAFGPKDLVCLLTTYSMLEFFHPALFNRAAESATARLHTFSGPELVHLLWAYGRFGVRPAHPQFLWLLGGRLHAARSALTTQALADVVKALARLRFKHEVWLTDLAAAAAARMEQCPPDALTRLLWGFSWLQHHDQALFDLSLRRMKDMYEQYWRYKVLRRHLSSVVESCDRLGVQPLGYRLLAEVTESGALTPYMRWQAMPSGSPPRPKMHELSAQGVVAPVPGTTIPDRPEAVAPSVPASVAPSVDPSIALPDTPPSTHPPSPSDPTPASPTATPPTPASAIITPPSTPPQSKPSSTAPPSPSPPATPPAPSSIIPDPHHCLTIPAPQPHPTPSNSHPNAPPSPSPPQHPSTSSPTSVQSTPQATGPPPRRAPHQTRSTRVWSVLLGR